jgi:hypothetical protein
MMAAPKLPATGVASKTDSNTRAQNRKRSASLISPALIDALMEHIADRHSSLNINEQLIIAIWIIHTYFYADCRITPYLHIASLVPDAGKSEIADILNDLCCIAFLDSPTVAALSTFKASGRHTLIMDEIQDLLNDKRGSIIPDLRRLINMGNKPGGHWTVSGDKPGDRDERDMFFPKAFIGIGPDVLNASLATRSIRIIVRPGTEAEQTERERRQRIRPVTATASKLKGALTSLAASEPARDAIRAGMQSPVTRSLNGNDERLCNRPALIWRVLITIADIAGHDYGKTIRDIAREYVDSEPEHLPTRAEHYDSGIKGLMRERKTTVDNWQNPGKAPLNNAVNFGMTDADFGFPDPRNGIRGKLPSASLILNTAEMRAELRFKAAEFGEICAAMPGKPSKSDVTRAYKDANRLHAGKQTSFKSMFHSGQGEVYLIGIDVSKWLWPDIEPLTPIQQGIERILAAETDADTWDADQ